MPRGPYGLGGHDCLAAVLLHFSFSIQVVCESTSSSNPVTSFAVVTYKLHVHVHVLYPNILTLTEEDDWNDVITECSSLAAKWKQLSGYLGLSFNLIDIIERNHSSDTFDYWNEALKQWIQQKYRTEKFGLPSWRTLLKAVARVDVLQFRKLADIHQGIVRVNKTDISILVYMNSYQLTGLNAYHITIVYLVGGAMQ